MNKSDKGELELLRLYRGLNQEGREGLLITARTFGTLEHFKAGTDFDEYQRAAKEKRRGKFTQRARVTFCG